MAEFVVLVVDDERDVRALARLVLEVSSHEVRVIEAADGPAALAAAAQERPDLAVVDQMMPGQDGISLITALRVMHPGLPIVLSSAAMDARLADRAEAAGVRWILPKVELVRLSEYLDELSRD